MFSLQTHQRSHVAQNLFYEYFCSNICLLPASEFMRKGPFVFFITPFYFLQFCRVSSKSQFGKSALYDVTKVSQVSPVLVVVAFCLRFNSKRSSFYKQNQRRREKKKHSKVKLGKAEEFPSSHFCSASRAPEAHKVQIVPGRYAEYNDNVERRFHNSGVEQLQNKLLHVASHRTPERMRFNRGAVAEQLTAATRRPPPYILLYPQPQFHPIT